MKRPLEGRDLRHVDEFLMSGAAQHLLSLGLFPDAKEISESMAAFLAVRQHMPGLWDLQDPSILCACIADGHTPRTGAVMHALTGWQVLSCDPAMRPAVAKEMSFRMPRLSALRGVAAELPEHEVERLVVVAVHAHNFVNRPPPGAIAQGLMPRPNILAETLGRLRAKEVLIVALPCCHRLWLPDREHVAEYHDPGIWSHHNRIKIWSFTNEGKPRS